MKKLKIILQYNLTYKVLIVITLIFSLVFISLSKESKYSGNEENFSCIILNYEIDGNKLSLDLKCKEKIKGIYYFKTEDEKLAYSKIKFGDKVKLKGNLTTPKENTIPNLFNYKKYLNNQGIHYILNIEEIEIKNSSKNIFYKIKNIVYNRVEKIPYNEYIYTYILGKNNNLELETLNNYRLNGISHLFALSGLHVSIFSLILLSIFKKLKINKTISYILTCSLLYLFSFISGFSPSILRATIFFTLISFNKLYNLNITETNLLYITFSLLVLSNPYIIYNLSFILSFTTTYFILLTSKYFKSKNIIITLLSISTLSFISTIGLSIYFFGSINPVGILLNIIFVPLVSYIVFPVTIISFLIPSFSKLLLISSSFMETLSNFLVNFKMTIYFPKITLTEVFLYYLLLILIIKTKKRKFIFLIIVLLTFWLIKPKFNYNDEIYYLDVGQGDSILIVTKNRKSSILIDTGGKIKYKEEEWKKQKKEYNIATDSIIPFLRSLGINKLDYLILSHGDYDHMGEGINLIEKFKVKKVIFNCGEFNNLERNLIKKLNKKKIPYYSCINELNIDNNKLYFLNNKDYNNENDNSSVIYTELNNHKFLFMGDAGINVEEDLIEKYNLKDIDVLKVGHHGSKTSSNKNFIDLINPKYSIISVGKNNRYGHPNKSVLDNLNGSKIYRTDINGTIMFKSQNNKLQIETFSP